MAVREGGTTKLEWGLLMAILGSISKFKSSNHKVKPLSFLCVNITIYIYVYIDNNSKCGYLSNIYISNKEVQYFHNNS